ncbi:MAG: hypothetical protein ACYDDF_13345 [Thermoplasmatota archaeon]
MSLQLDMDSISERVADDLAQYSRWAETLEAFPEGGWGIRSA